MFIGLSFLERVTKELDAKDIPYMLVGGMVLNFYSIPRMTRDFDIMIQLERKDIRSFVNIFEGNAYIYEPSVVEEIERKGMFNVIDWQTSFKIDFTVLSDSEYYQAAFNRRVSDNSLGFDVWICSPEDLILTKLIWIQTLESEKQKQDIQFLLMLENIDLQYIKYWTQKLSLKTYELL